MIDAQSITLPISVTPPILGVELCTSDAAFALDRGLVRRFGPSTCALLDGRDLGRQSEHDKVLSIQ